jgi:ribosomal protein S6
MENTEKDKKNYEIAFLVKNEDDIPGVVSFLNQHDVEILTEPRAKNVALAYEIKKNKEAVFAYSTFKATAADVKNLEKDISMGNEIIRSLITSLPKKSSRSEVVEERAPERKMRTSRPTAPYSEAKLSSPRTLSNEALEKKIEEILK